MSESIKADGTVRVLVNEALSTAIERGDSQAVIDVLSITQEYIQSGESGDFHTPPANVPENVLPAEYPVERLQRLD